MPLPVLNDERDLVGAGTRVSVAPEQALQKGIDTKDTAFQNPGSVQPDTSIGELQGTFPIRDTGKNIVVVATHGGSLRQCDLVLHPRDALPTANPVPQVNCGRLQGDQRSGTPVQDRRAPTVPLKS